MEKYFTHAQGARLFRLTEDNTSQRWDAKAKTWVVVPSDFLYRETVVRPSPDYTEITAEQAAEQFPGSVDGPVQEVSDADIDWPFSVEMMSKIMAAVVSGDYAPAAFIADHQIPAEIAPYVVRFWDLIQQAVADLPAGQSLAPPTEWM